MTDPRWSGSEAELVERIRDEILAAPAHRITFARFMQRALSEPRLGYYASTDRRPTRSGDFLTAPELHPFFGRCIGRFLTGLWQGAGAARPFRIREYGAGRGTLRDTALGGLTADQSALAQAIEWQSLDLPGRGDDPSPLARCEVVLANEYLDALPVHRVIGDGGPKEIYVDWQDGWFGESIAELSDEALAEQLRADGIDLAEGQRAEVCLAAPRWMRDTAGATELILMIDYGHAASELYSRRRMAGSLLTYRAHAVDDDPFASVGNTDITAHVDTSALSRAADEAGLRLLGSTSQAHFLSALGLGQLLADLGQDPDTTAEDYVAARSSVARLIDPRQLGGFKVMAWGRGPGRDAETALPGFQSVP